MHKPMDKWSQDIIASDVRKALPVLSFPCTQLQGITVKELVTHSDRQAEGMAMVAQRCDAAAAVSMMDLSVEAECFGCPIRFSDNEVPTVSAAILKTPEDADALKVPPFGTGRTGTYVEAIAKSVEMIKDRPVFAGAIGPFSLAGRLMDMTEIMVNCYDEPEMVETTMEKVTDFLISYIREYKKVGANGVVMAEPAAGLLSPALCEEFSTPYIRRITDALQDNDFIFIYHNCGPNVARMTDAIIDTGCSAFHFGNAADMETMLAKLPADKLVMGNLDPVSVIRYGTAETVRKATLELMEKCCGHKNYLVSSGCDIPPLTPWENIDAFFAAVAEFYGK